MRNSTYAIVASAVAMLSSSAAHAEMYAFTDVSLTPEQQSPAAQSDGKGWLNAIYDSTTKTLTYVVNWQLKSGNIVSAAHFHGPGAIGTNAGVQIAVTLSGINAGKAGGSVTLTASKEAELLAGNWYFNIHRVAFPAGEIRGQLVENSGAYNGAGFNATTNTVGINNVYVLGSGNYDVTLMLKSLSQPLTFELTSATKVR